MFVFNADIGFEFDVLIKQLRITLYLILYGIIEVIRLFVLT